MRQNYEQILFTSRKLATEEQYRRLASAAASKIDRGGLWMPALHWILLGTFNLATSGGLYVGLKRDCFPQCLCGKEFLLIFWWSILRDLFRILDSWVPHEPAHYSLRSQAPLWNMFPLSHTPNLMRFHSPTLLPSLKPEVRTSFYATLIDLYNNCRGTIIDTILFDSLCFDV